MNPPPRHLNSNPLPFLRPKLMCRLLIDVWVRRSTSERTAGCFDYSSGSSRDISAPNRPRKNQHRSSRHDASEARREKFCKKSGMCFMNSAAFTFLSISGGRVDVRQHREADKQGDSRGDSLSGRGQKNLHIHDN